MVCMTVVIGLPMVRGNRNWKGSRRDALWLCNVRMVAQRGGGVGEGRWVGSLGLRMQAVARPGREVQHSMHPTRAITGAIARSQDP